MYLIKAANTAFNGVRLGVVFKNGACQTNDKKVAESLKARGYDVTVVEAKPKKKNETKE